MSLTSPARYAVTTATGPSTVVDQPTIMAENLGALTTPRPPKAEGPREPVAFIDVLQCGFCGDSVVPQYVDMQPERIGKWRMFCQNPACTAKGPWGFSREGIIRQHVEVFG